METKKYYKLSVAALSISLLPLATFIPVLMKITLSDTVRSIWAGGNIVCVVLGLIFSAICVKSNESRSAINIASTVISSVWAVMMAGIVALAQFCAVRKPIAGE